MRSFLCSHLRPGLVGLTRMRVRAIPRPLAELVNDNRPVRLRTRTIAATLHQRRYQAFAFTPSLAMPHDSCAHEMCGDRPPVPCSNINANSTSSKSRSSKRCVLRCAVFYKLAESEFPGLVPYLHSCFVPITRGSHIASATFLETTSA